MLISIAIWRDLSANSFRCIVVSLKYAVVDVYKVKAFRVPVLDFGRLKTLGETRYRHGPSLLDVSILSLISLNYKSY